MTANPHLQLCVNDLLHPTEKSESLLEALTSSQLEEIEKTLSKIKIKKQSSQNVTTSTQSPMTQTANPSALHHDWALVAAQIAKALADSITTAANTSATNNNNNNNANSASNNAKPPVSSPQTAGAASVKSPATSTVSTSTASSKSTSNTNNTATSTSSNTPANPASSSTAAAAGSVVPNHEPRTEIREGVEWVSFVYSHHRVLRRYSIRTDVDQVDLDILDDKFKSENCVYPRANLPRDEYKGNRWAYETECNTLGWKLAHLNSSEIAGKRGLIQRAVDSYRNRYPSMRSRRVARQEKLLKGTLRKRKQRESEELAEDEERAVKSVKSVDSNSVVSTSAVSASTSVNAELPKTVTIDDGVGGAKHRIRINVETVSLDTIDMQFRRANCVYPRAMEINTSSPFASQRQIEEAKCNELGWKLAWLNPKQLANRKNLLQRVLDVYRTKFIPELNPRKNSLRMPNPPNRLSIDTDMLTAKDETVGSSTPLTIAALAAQQQELATPKIVRRGGRGSADKVDDDESLYSGTTDSLDFHDCFSPPADATTTNSSLFLDTTKVESCNSPSTSDSSMLLSPNASINELMLSIPTSSDDLLFGSSQHPLFVEPGHDSCRHSISSSSSGGSDLVASPYVKTEHLDETLFKDTAMFELYAEPIQLPSAGVDFEQCDYIKTEDDHLMDPLMSQLFHI
ncbi:hypothetical protein HMPREF1544_07676 [Mucor circinelloides 1006PhL]|uniref:DUF8032 domain-containing protein n=1 Tax=Mucor circinelloides f. circinelloides (strain 1006PhL) TaxID=1220926 RepID=S2JAW9_MUCC1|nr:hypothetical protein HMPREF1544_07676 [Mucor circinelloides 1006PhL]